MLHERSCNETEFSKRVEGLYSVCYMSSIVSKCLFSLGYVTGMDHMKEKNTCVAKIYCIIVLHILLIHRNNFLSNCLFTNRPHHEITCL